jgi:hypothetical protein
MAEKVLTATTPSQRVAALQNVLTGHLADTDPLISANDSCAAGDPCSLNSLVSLWFQWCVGRVFCRWAGLV